MAGRINRETGEITGLLRNDGRNTYERADGSAWEL